MCFPSVGGFIVPFSSIGILRLNAVVRFENVNIAVFWSFNVKFLLNWIYFCCYEDCKKAPTGKNISSNKAPRKKSMRQRNTRGWSRIHQIFDKEIKNFHGSRFLREKIAFCNFWHLQAKTILVQETKPNYVYRERSYKQLSMENFWKEWNR